MKNNKIIIYLTIIGLIIIIGIPTICKVIKNHKEKLYMIVEKRIVEAANKCFNEDVCQGNETTLGFLYQNNYLKKEADPNTKKYYSDSSIIIKKETETLFYPE